MKYEWCGHLGSRGKCFPQPVILPEIFWWEEEAREALGWCVMGSSHDYNILGPPDQPGVSLIDLGCCVMAGNRYSHVYSTPGAYPVVYGGVIPICRLGKGVLFHRLNNFTLHLVLYSKSITQVIRTVVYTWIHPYTSKVPADTVGTSLVDCLITLIQCSSVWRWQSTGAMADKCHNWQLSLCFWFTWRVFEIYWKKTCSLLTMTRHEVFFWMSHSGTFSVNQLGFFQINWAQ